MTATHCPRVCIFFYRSKMGDIAFTCFCSSEAKWIIEEIKRKGLWGLGPCLIYSRCIGAKKIQCCELGHITYCLFRPPYLLFFPTVQIYQLVGRGIVNYCGIVSVTNSQPIAATAQSPIFITFNNRPKFVVSNFFYFIDLNVFFWIGSLYLSSKRFISRSNYMKRKLMKIYKPSLNRRFLSCIQMTAQITRAAGSCQSRRDLSLVMFILPSVFIGIQCYFSQTNGHFWKKRAGCD